MVSIVSFTKQVFISIAFALLVQGVAIPQLEGGAATLEKPKAKRAAPGTLSLDLAINRNHDHSNFTYGPHYVILSNAKRDSYIEVTLYNEQVTYSANITVGSDHQVQNVIIDTGSSDLWVVDSSATCQAQSGYASDYCFSGGSYNRSTSSTYQSLGTAFGILYGDGSSSTGTWAVDTVGISGAVITNQQFGDVTSTSVEQGILGIGLDTNESIDTIYDNLPINLKNQGYISTNGYSLYLNSRGATTGSIIFGGIDHAKYRDTLTTLPITSTTEFRIQTNSVTVGKSTISIDADMLLDSGTTLTYLPLNVVSRIASAVGGLTYNRLIGAYTWACNRIGNLTYNFPQGLSINIPYSDLAVQLYYTDGTVADICAFGILSGSLNILGDNFLRHAYVAYNLDAKTISLAPVVYTPESNITTF
ncbi:Candidapepsin-8 [Candida viswanathii]|uniref:candidapepsin n=1 Tax=Candida viswanathii TaxID=5486 RepID=A0A367Y0E6_9ASCO|nr:Candidapepsin-8 [Candida viswanathii]